jgi:hypothetical protein
VFLSKLQPDVPIHKSLEVEFVADFEKGQQLAHCFNINLEREGIDQLIGDDLPMQNPLLELKEHLDVLCSIDVDLYSLFTLAINLIFYGGSSHAVGGTTSAAIGVIWGNPENGWKTCDYLEYFMHELTHTLMFLDELRFLHYKDLDIMYEKENFSLSAILQANRPVDRVLHSIIVATEVLMLRMRNLVDHSDCQIHPSTEQLVETTQKSIDHLLSHPNRDRLLTPRSLEIIEVCQNNLSKHFAMAAYA